MNFCCDGLEFTEKIYNKHIKDLLESRIGGREENQTRNQKSTRKERETLKKNMTVCSGRKRKWMFSKCVFAFQKMEILRERNRQQMNLVLQLLQRRRDELLFSWVMTSGYNMYIHLQEMERSCQSTFSMIAAVKLFMPAAHFLLRKNFWRS